MDKLISKRPNAALLNADRKIKDYIILLEAIVIDTNARLPNPQAMQVLQFKNADLAEENKKLRIKISTLQKELQQFKVKNIETPTSSSNGKEIHSSVLKNVADNDLTANNVLIKGFTEEQLNAIPKVNIINLGNIMNIELSEKDILKIAPMKRKFYERHNLKPLKPLLIVTFRTPEMKMEFLKNKGKLQLHSRLHHIEINDYVSDECFNLYEYAKILKSCGYAQVYWQNNSVYAKKTRSSFCEPILIRSKNDVDILKTKK